MGGKKPNNVVSVMGWSLAIVLGSASLGILLDWNAPGIDRYTRDLLIRARGPLPAPDDIAIVAIDEESVARFGRFPWPRQVIAHAIDALAASRPKVIALDVLFSEPTNAESDNELARSIRGAGNVVVAAQLIGSSWTGGPARWLLPVESIRGAAAAVGHVNVQTELEGVARQLAVRESDSTGHAVWSMAVEAVAVAGGTPAEGITSTPQAVLVGPHRIPLEFSPPSTVIAEAQPGRRPPQVLNGGRMTIDYLGPTGSFNPSTYSLAEVLEGKVAADRFRGKYVLIGATAAGLGDRIASPFVHKNDAGWDQNGTLMPGVEVLANAVNTVLRFRFYSRTSDAAAFFWAVLIAAATLTLLEVAQGGSELLRQVGALALMIIIVVGTGYLVCLWVMMFPPLAPAMVSFASASILGLLRRSLVTSARLDRDLEELAQSSDVLAAVQAGPLQRARFPRGLAWKAEQLRMLQSRLLGRAKFVDQALRSIEDGLIIAAPDGSITFANRTASATLGSEPRVLIGQNMFRRLGLSSGRLLSHIVLDGTRIEREIELGKDRVRRYILRIDPVSSMENSGGPLLGIVASLSDVTRQHELQQVKNDIVALVSHEMRAPLTVIQGMSEILANNDLRLERRREVSAAINDAVKRLSRLIAEYLNVTHFESGAIALHKTPVHLDSLLERLLLLLEPMAAQHGIRLIRDFAPDLSVVADADLLSRAVDNLVSNAIKYSPERTEVTVATCGDESSVWIAVTDEGYGIPAADLPRVFVKFYRVLRIQDAGSPGAGLGLSLVRQIAELHGGSVTVKSDLGKGSTFTLRIPANEHSNSELADHSGRPTTSPRMDCHQLPANET